MAPLRPSGSRAAAPTAVVKGRAALTRLTKEGRLQTRPPATCASRNQTCWTSVPKLRSQNIQRSRPPTRHPTRRSKPVLASSTHFQCKCGALRAPVLSWLRSALCHRPHTARHHHHVASNDPSVCTPPDCPRPLRIPTASAHGRGGRSYRPPASLARVLSRPLLTSSVAATRARKQS